MAAEKKLKASVDIEKLLQWAYLDELPKRQISSADGIWNRLQQYGSLGGINPDPGGSGNAQRYAQFGLPHKDAEAIEQAVGALGGVTVDWQRDFYEIAGDLAALITVNDLSARRRRFRGTGYDRKNPGTPSGYSRDQLDRTPLAEFNYIREHHRGRLRRGLRAASSSAVPRDVLLLNTINAAALVTIHAVKRTRPQWQHEPLMPGSADGPTGRPVLIGESRGKHLYTEGSYCPVRWSPSPIDVVLGRADYHVWRQALVTLAATLDLDEHQALPPAATVAPWHDPGTLERMWLHAPMPQQRPLPLKPQRPYSGPPRRRPKADKPRKAV